ncbi:uncharacterized protein LACBIDRAFT_296126 [Laccaria bicolor S238N-H82]|uniref:Predicted protein n=1 Tax=Laccaria bicolor (strain S238N-H82 / ATCC MYA-4686) TaxID=486041 RepID=B0E2W1_LACBS|nr:uncharacterized protein LACBIDRAFT_296126 [Laccaria bicolor S238N-H82]EDQ98819.1 predicted protein [Laccaria bicolor S238N-H82]|eukprot:XP_001890529.1 predicted protein [Laccaria bicolor S238N-H82]
MLSTLSMPSMPPSTSSLTTGLASFTPGRCAESALAVLPQWPHSPHRPRILRWSKSSILQPAPTSSTPPSTSSTMPLHVDDVNNVILTPLASSAAGVGWSPHPQLCLTQLTHRHGTSFRHQTTFQTPLLCLPHPIAVARRFHAERCSKPTCFVNVVAVPSPDVINATTC